MRGFEIVSEGERFRTKWKRFIIKGYEIEITVLYIRDQGTIKW